MLTKWITSLRRKWQMVSGGIALLLMFFIPITRVVLAANEAPNPNSAVNNANANAGGQVSDHTGASSGTSGSGPTTPRNPSPMSSAGGSTSGAGNSTGPSQQNKSGGHKTGGKKQDGGKSSAKNKPRAK